MPLCFKVGKKQKNENEAILSVCRKMRGMVRFVEFSRQISFKEAKESLFKCLKICYNGMEIKRRRKIWQKFLRQRGMLPRMRLH